MCEKKVLSGIYLKTSVNNDDKKDQCCDETEVKVTYDK